ncbi:MAG: M48 family metallopeptidase [Oleispira antarctica]|nr:M48 family metallopeptidase [Oleispira antarctica]MBQ0792423.1 M48 family metallopeptidase [Oleispira antarctica]
MDFFGHQDQARKRTKQLVLLFALALLTLIFLTNLLVAGFLWGNPDIFPGLGNKVIRDPSLFDIFHYMSWRAWLIISAVVCGFVGLAYLYKVIKLSGGGVSIAHSLGGRLLKPDSEDFYERRLLNIVEEMAIASGMPVPQVFLLDDEIGINAFAAGFQPSDAIIGVTKGCLTKLSRLQLQGVIGHEFSHILNGDMRMNMRLIAILFGILCIGLLGRIILEAGARHSIYSRGRSQSSMFSSSSNKKEGGVPLFLIGIGFMILGYSGVFFGKLIQAAVSRQREYLADASAVQFTRDPQAIAEALKVIGYGGVGSAIGHSRREEFSHAFFGNAIYSHFSSHFGFLSTHPKLEERIRRIDKNWDGEWVQPQTLKQAYDESPQLAPQNKIRPEELLTGVAAAMSAAIDFTAPNSTVEGIPTQNTVDAESELTNAAHDPLNARGLCYALLLAPNSSLVHEQQLDLIQQYCGDGLLRSVNQLIPLVARLDESKRLPMIDKAIPALKLLSADQYRNFKQLLVKIVQADGKIDLFEWCLYRMILQYLNPTFDKAKAIKAKYGNVKKLSSEIETVLSFVANHGHDSLEGALKSFAIAATTAGFEGLQLQAKTSSFKSFNVALDTLTQAFPHVKGRIMKALAACVRVNGVEVAERELVQTIAAILECPTPDLFD